MYTDSLSQRGRPVSPSRSASSSPSPLTSTQFLFRKTPKYADAGIDSTSDSDNGDSDGGAQQRASIHSRTRALSVSMMSAQTQGPRSDGRYHLDTLRAGRVTADDDDLDAKLARRGRRMSISVDRKKRDAAIASLGFTDQDLGPVSDGAALGSPTPNQLQLAAAPTSSPHCPRLSAGIANPSGGPTAASGISAAIAMRLLGALQKIRLERELDEMHLSISLKVTKTVVKLDSIGCTPPLHLHFPHFRFRSPETLTDPRLGRSFRSSSCEAPPR